MIGVVPMWQVFRYVASVNVFGACRRACGWRESLWKGKLR